MLIIEFDKKFHKPGKYRAYPQEKLFLRVWCGWIAVTITNYDLVSLFKDIRDDKLAWHNYS